MKTDHWLSESTQKLVHAGIGTARLDALVLLEDITGHDRAWLLANPEAEISPEQVAQLEKLLTLRAQHTPLAYVRGKTEFYGREFIITPAVLEPRPESETMIDLLKAVVIKHPKLRIADVGTGSGALGITAALEVSGSQVELLDIDPRALKVAKSNVDKFTPSISVVKSDLLSGATINYDILLCNLPYVPDDYQINLAATHEPRLAIFGGPDGLDLYRRLFDQIKQLQVKPLYILCEALPPKHPFLQSMAAKGGYRLLSGHDFIQVFELSNHGHGA